VSDLGVSSLQDADHKPQHKHARSCLAVLVALAVIVALGAFAYVKGVDLIRGVLSGPPDYSGAGHGSVIVQVKKGTLTDIGVVLEKSDVVKSVQAFTDAAKTSDSATSIQPGYYRLHKQMSGQAALALLVLGRDHDAVVHADAIRTHPEFPHDVGDALAFVAAQDVVGYTYAVEDVLESFETREEYLEDIPVADTVLVLQALAARRGFAVELSSPLLPEKSEGA